jgi:S-disulfanyl-L-cysteine oxidoreductase SoxD
MQNPLPLFLVLGAAAVVGGVALARLDARGHFADAGDTALVAHGAAVYAANCASCHGAHLEGAPDWKEAGPGGVLRAPPHDETGHTWMHSDDMLFHLTKFGLADIAPPGFVSTMPAFDGKLSDSDIVAAVAFIKTRWPVGVRVFQAMLNPRWEGMPAAAQGDDWHLPADCGTEPIRLISDTVAGQASQ